MKAVFLFSTRQQIQIQEDTKLANDLLRTVDIKDDDKFGGMISTVKLRVQAGINITSMDNAAHTNVGSRDSGIW